MGFKDKMIAASKIEAFLISIYLLGVYFFPDRIKLVSICFVLFFCLTLLAHKKKIIIRISSLLWLCYIIFSFLSFFWGKGRHDDVLEFIVSISIALLLSVFDFSEEERKSQLKGLTIVCFVVVLGCLLQFVSPELLKEINKKHLTIEQYRFFEDFLRAKRLAGFSFQTAITGFYLTILFGIVFSELLCSFRKNSCIKNIVYSLFLVFLYTLIFLTAKRIFILLIPCGVLVLLCLVLRKHIGKVVLAFSIVAAFMVILLLKTDFGQSLLLRSLGDNWSTGREKINEQTIEMFRNSPLFGNGICSTLVMLSGYQNAHNIYLQVLSESGIVGFCIIVSAFIIGLAQNIKVLSFAIKSQEKKSLSIASTCLFIQIIFWGWGLTGNPLYDVYPLFIYMLSIGCINTIEKKQRMEILET